MRHCDSLAQRKKLDQSFLDTGIDTGFQKAVDFFSIALNDPDVMGSNALGEKRLIKVLLSVADLDYRFRNAYNMEVDSDYLQEQLDGRLKEIFKSNFSPFKERYPKIQMATYEEAKKGWK